MTTRLDRLLQLLQNGSTPVVRATAARQLGAIAAQRIGRGSTHSSAGASSLHHRLPSKSRSPNLTSPKLEFAPPDPSETYYGLDGEWTEVINLLVRILPYLRDRATDTRLAAALAIEHVLLAAGVWYPPCHVMDDGAAHEAKPILHGIRLQDLDIVDLLMHEPTLLASSGAEYASIEGVSKTATADLVKSLGLSMPGLGDTNLGLDVEKELASAVQGDLHNSLPVANGSQRPHIKIDTSTVSTASNPSDGVGDATLTGLSSSTTPRTAAPVLSKREQAALKRKRKLDNSARSAGPVGSNPLIPASATSNKVRIIDVSAQSARADPTDAQPTSVKIESNRKSEVEEYAVGGRIGEAVTVAYKRTPSGSGQPVEEVTWLPEPEQWPFDIVVKTLQRDLLDAAWEIRHGAALGLRGFYKIQGSSGGMMASYDFSSNSALHDAWTEDAASRLLTVLARDRFGDFLGDHVVAPVRETAAQCLAALLNHIGDATMSSIEDKLSHMVSQQEIIDLRSNTLPQGRKAYFWEARHAALVALCYIYARPDISTARQVASSLQQPHGRSSILDTQKHGQSAAIMTQSRVQQAFATCLIGMRDVDDDVRGCAAVALQPLATAVLANLSDSELDDFSDLLQISLADQQDDLASSVASILDLVGNLLGDHRFYSNLAKHGARRLVALVCSLRSYSRHTLESVRRSVVGMFVSLVSRESTDCLPAWVDQTTLRLLYENVVLERQIDIRNDSVSVILGLLNNLKASTAQQALRDIVLPLLPGWLHIIMTPPGQALPTGAFLRARKDSGGHDIDQAMMAQDLSLVPTEETLGCRLAAARVLSAMLAIWPVESHEADLRKIIIPYLSSDSGHQVTFACIVIQDWSRTATARFGHRLLDRSPFFQQMSVLVDCKLLAPPPSSYAEIGALMSNLQPQAQQLLRIFITKGKVPKAKVPDLTTVSPVTFALEIASRIATSDFEALLALMSDAARTTALPILNEARNSLQSSIAQVVSRKDALDVQVFAALAGVAIELQTIPAKLNPLVRSLMNAVKFEVNSQLQRRAGQSVAEFAQLCMAPNTSIRNNPMDKIVKNLCTFLCQDQEVTPLFAKCGTLMNGIMPGPVTPSTNSMADISGNQLAQRGSIMAIQSMFDLFQSSTFVRLPKLWSCCAEMLLIASPDQRVLQPSTTMTDTQGQDVLDSLTILAAIARILPKTVHNEFGNVIASVTRLVQHEVSVIRHLASRCIGQLCACLPHLVMPAVVADLVPALADPLTLHRRQGAVEAIAYIVEAMGLEILPYIVFLMVPIMARNTDSDADVRNLAVRTFAQLVKIAPLDSDLPDPDDFPAELLQQRDEERRFVSQLLDGSKVSPYAMSVPVAVELRKYQREGVAWLAFLAKYHLHGILCDDMGLGKTLQSICILASMTRDRAQSHASTPSSNTVHLPSLVICPPTLTGHWLHEVQTYVADLRAVLYVGDRASRIRTSSTFSKVDVVVTSYDVVRNDIDLLRDVRWHYCILDEGHIIKNAKTKLTQAVKQLQAVHRLILTGTPIQNNVLELWSLFDFLMPGFLGTEDDFSKRFSKPIQQSRNAKSSSKEQERGTLALDALHKQVLPFLLRRLKEDVLDDLPPKIIQDYYCSLSDLQLSLYDKASAAAAAGHDSSDSAAASPHAFQTLQYLRKLVNHPLLVLDDNKSQDLTALSKLGYSSTSDPKLRRLEEAPKLLALQQLLLDNGIGLPVKKEEEELETAPASHRFLVFCQLKTMLDLIEQDLFRAHMPELTYMRLDGSTPASQRHALVQKFNGDPTIDVLLLTTHVGGLGLNLTGADTVVFVEHDWNPMKDLQAMDRAHRLGQKKTVNVYRLITQGTLEEKIMGLQKFKLNIAGSVVNQQNADMATMDTQNVVDLFKMGDETISSVQRDDKPMTQKQLLASLAELDEGDADYSNLL